MGGGTVRRLPSTEYVNRTQGIDSFPCLFYALLWAAVLCCSFFSPFNMYAFYTYTLSASCFQNVK